MFPFSSSGVKAADTRDQIEKLDLAFNQLADNAEIEVRDLVKKTRQVPCGHHGDGT